MVKMVTCQECGAKLESAATKHTLKDCGEHHLKRAFDILGKPLILVRIAEEM